MEKCHNEDCDEFSSYWRNNCNRSLMGCHVYMRSKDTIYCINDKCDFNSGDFVNNCGEHLIERELSDCKHYAPKPELPPTLLSTATIKQLQNALAEKSSVLNLTDKTITGVAMSESSDQIELLTADGLKFCFSIEMPYEGGEYIFVDMVEVEDVIKIDEDVDVDKNNIEEDGLFDDLIEQYQKNRPNTVVKIVKMDDDIAIEEALRRKGQWRGGDCEKTT